MSLSSNGAESLSSPSTCPNASCSMGDFPLWASADMVAHLGASAHLGKTPSKKKEKEGKMLNRGRHDVVFAMRAYAMRCWVVASRLSWYCTCNTLKQWFHVIKAARSWCVSIPSPSLVFRIFQYFRYFGHSRFAGR